jgi:hypothetical protein
MDAREAQTLEHGDCILYQGQLFKVAQVFHHGNLVHLNGKLGDQIVSPRNMTLVWRKADVPSNVQVGHLTIEEEYEIRRLIEARKAQDKGTGTGKDKETERTG